jgi:hypothetical protein
MRLADLLAGRGDLNGARHLLQAAVSAGLDSATPRLLDVLAKQGRKAEADQLRRFGFNPDGAIASARELT